MKRKKILKGILIVILVLALIELCAIGWLGGLGPLGFLMNVRVGILPGNAKKYSFDSIEKIEGSKLEDKNVCILGSSVVYGMYANQDSVGEYIAKRFGCNLTKEAVSGTTLADVDQKSYISRMKKNIGSDKSYDLFICQLSTNDASKDIPLGNIVNSQNKDDFDVLTVTGAISYIICYANEMYDCPIVFFTGSYYENDNYAKMVKRLYELQEVYDFEIIDLYTNTEFNDISADEYKLYMYDSIHPTRAGYRDWWGPEIEKRINEIID